LGGGNNNNEPKQRIWHCLGHRCVFLFNFSCFFFYFSCFFYIVDPPTLNHVFWLPATRLNTPSMHFNTHIIQTTHFDPHRPTKAKRRPTMANKSQHRPKKYQQGPKQPQTCRLGPRYIFFLKIHIFHTLSIIFKVKFMF
jgi:hypothetical protein